MDISKLLQILPFFILICLFGSAILKAFRIHTLKGIAHLSVSFWIGIACTSILFLLIAWSGRLSESAIWAVLLLGAPALFWRRAPRRGFWHVDKEHFFSILFILTVLITLPSAMIPATEASSLAFHFAIPKQIAVNESLTFNEIATTHSAPMLFHLIGAAAYKIGEESMLQLSFWMMSIMSALAVFTLARRRLRIGASWLLATLVMSLPVMINSAGTGLIEPRLMGPVITAILFLTLYARSEQKRWLALTALMTGLVLGAHDVGILMAFSIFFGVLLAAKDFGLKKCARHLGIFTAITFITGGWFYLINLIQTGHFTFPQVSNTPAKHEWSTAQWDIFQTHYIDAFTYMERTFWNWLWNYPLDMTVNSASWGVSHMAFGPLFLIVLVPSLFIFLRRFPFISWEKQIGTLELMATIFITFYALWFAFGNSMEPKYLTPVFPLILIPAYILGQNLRAHASFFARNVLMGSVFVLIALQLGLAINTNRTEISVFFRYTDDSIYQNNMVPATALATYLNTTLPNDAAVLHTNIGSLNYQLNRKVVYTPPILQESAPFITGEPVDVLNSTFREKVTHWVTDSDPTNPRHDSIFNGNAVLRNLISHGCFKKDVAMTANNNTSSHVYYVYVFVENCAGQSH